MRFVAPILIMVGAAVDIVALAFQPGHQLNAWESFVVLGVLLVSAAAWALWIRAAAQWKELFEQELSK